jgi:hypothetical protein
MPVAAKGISVVLVRDNKQQILGFHGDFLGRCRESIAACSSSQGPRIAVAVSSSCQGGQQYKQLCQEIRQPQTIESAATGCWEPRERE